MSDWWTYRPADFLMFAPRTYWRLFEMQNEALWPAQPLLVLAGVGWMLGLWRLRTPAARWGAVGLAVVWAFVAWTFLLQRYAPINLAAPEFAVGFLMQALGLAALATRGDVSMVRNNARLHVGMLLLAWALVGHPLLAVAFGRPLTQAEVFGLAPDPTAIATLGFLLLIAARSGAASWLLKALWILPLVWCAISAATLWTVGAAQWWVLLAAGLVAVAGAWLRRPLDSPIP